MLFAPQRRYLRKIGASPPPRFSGIEISKVACGHVTLWRARDRKNIVFGAQEPFPGEQGVVRCLLDGYVGDATYP